jgi:hypothetical protein
MKKLIQMPLFLLAFATFASAQPVAPKIYELSLLSENKALEIIVNGFPLSTLPESGNQGGLETLLSPFLKSGPNLIKVDMRPLASAGGDADSLLVLRCVSRADLNSEARTVVFEVERTDNPENDQPNARTTVKVADQGLFRLGSPGGASGDSVVIDISSPSISFAKGSNGVAALRINANFDDAPLVSLPWEGDPVDPTEADRAAMRAKLEQLHRAVDDADYTGIANLLDAKYSRMATAVGAPKADLIASETAVLSQFIGKPDFVIEPFNPAALVFEGVAGVNLVRVTSGSDGPIRGADGEVQFSITPYFSKVGSEWVLVE